MRISTTTIESFRLFSSPANEWMTEAELQASIRGEFTPNRNVFIGRAFGSVLERPERYKVPGGYRVQMRGTDVAIELGDEVMAEPLALIERELTVFEAKAVKRYGDHDVVSKADQLKGARLIETKATLGSFDIDKYTDSCQWRFMVDAFQPACVTYHVFCLDEDERNGVIRFKGAHTFNLYGYRGLHDDCADMVEGFAAYCRMRGLDGLLNERQEAA